VLTSNSLDRTTVAKERRTKLIKEDLDNIVLVVEKLPWTEVENHAALLAEWA
jgi:hypothetical protein